MGAAAALPAVASTATTTTALGTGLTAGSILGTGAATTGLLGQLGLNALGGMTSILPASAGLTAASPALLTPALAAKGLTAAAPGIFSQATPALAGLKSVATPGLFQTAGMSPLGGMASMVPAGTSLPGAVAPNLVGQNQVLNAFQQAQLNPFKGAELGKVAELGKTSTELASKTPVLDAAVKGYPTTPVPPYNPATDPNLQEALRAQAAKVAAQQTPIVKGENFISNLGNLISKPSMQGVKDIAEEHPYATSAVVGLGAQALLGGKKRTAPAQDKGMIRPYTFDYNPNAEAYEVSPTAGSKEQVYFAPTFTAQEPHKAASGGIASAYAIGGPVEQMAAQNAVGANTGYPMAGINTSMYSNPMVQRPEAVNVLAPSSDAGVGAYSGEPKFAKGGETTGGYQYSYDPQTMQFTQIAAPAPVPTPRSSFQNQNNPYQLGGALSRRRSKASTSAASVPTAPVVSGGIAQPAVQPAAPMAAQPAYTGPTIPAYQTPEQQLGLTDFYTMMDERLGQMGGYAAGGGVSHLGDYSDGGRLLKGPGDGVSDSIPAVIGKRQPARLADGEFVIPARIVSELGNGSTEAGARKLYAMMDRIQKGRRKSVGKGKVAVDSKSDKHLPA